MQYVIQSKEDKNKYWGIIGNPRNGFEMGYTSDRTVAETYSKELADEIAENYDGITIPLRDIWFHT